MVIQLQTLAMLLHLIILLMAATLLLTAKRMNVKLSTMLPIKSSRVSTLSSSKNRTCRQ